MHPTDRKIFTKMIRLLRRKRVGSGTNDDPESSIEMIEPVAPTPDKVSPNDLVFEPSLRIVSEDELDAAELEGELHDFPRVDPARSGSEDGDGEHSIRLEIHNTDDDDGAGNEALNGAAQDADASDSDTAADDGEEPVRGSLLHTVPFRETRLAKIEEEPVANPSFNIFANARIWRHDERNLNYSGEVAKLYRDVFTPTRPKKTYRDFSGRRDTIETIIQAVEEERSHVILLGEKSLGKTSLLNVVSDCATEAGYLVARMTATADMTFRHFIVLILEQFTQRIEESPVRDILQRRLGTEDLCDLIDPDAELDVPAAIKIFQRLSEHQAIVMVDDFHRIENEELKLRLGELMGVLSDQGAWLSLLLFGRAARASEILPEAFQTLPNVTWIKLQPMNDEDAARVIARGVASVGVQFSDEVTESIVRLSQGMPSAIQWLCLLAIRNATQRYASEVEMHDLAEVVTAAVTKIDAKLSTFYDQVCGPTRGSWADDVLYLAVQTPADANGVFSTNSMSQIAHDVIGRPLLELPLHSALSRFTDEDSDPMLEKVWTSSGTCYRFIDPAMRAIVMLKNCGRMPNMPEALLQSGDNVELLPSPGTAPGVA
jgi:hypothetical protein